jgi:serine/threonine-protein kinase HipA
MSVSAISVNLWGQRVCAIAVDEGGQLNTQFDPQFLKNNLDIAPISLPLECLRQNPNQIRRFNDLPEKTFRGLPAFLVDSLPDDFGNALVNQYMASKGILPRNVTVLDRLAYTGKRAMGAFEFEPASKDIVKNKSALEMSNLVEMASKALRCGHILWIDLYPHRLIWRCDSTFILRLAKRINSNIGRLGAYWCNYFGNYWHGGR